MKARQKTGSLIFDQGRNKWRFLWWTTEGKRRSRIIGSKEQFTERAAWQEVERLKLSPAEKPADEMTVRKLVTKWQAERFPTRHDTQRVYRSFLNCHVLPQWGDQPLSAIQPQPVEAWLKTLPLSPKSKTHVRSLMHGLMEFGMFVGVLQIGRNPISLVRNTGATQKTRQARNLTVSEFRALVKELHEPFATLALCCATLGLRISEALGLKWSDVDFLGSRLTIQRSIVAQVVDATKTIGSQRSIAISDELSQRLLAWKQASDFQKANDWVFASPQKIGRLPYSYTGVRRVIQDATKVANIPAVATHAFRHSFRTWLGASGVPLELQRELMRHSTVGMTLKYGQTFDPAMKAASDKVADLIFANGSHDGSHSA